MIACSIVALLLAAGLAVDGSAQVHLRRTCAIAAAQVARAGVDAAAGDRLQEADQRMEIAKAAAREAASQLYPGLAFDIVSATDGRLTVRFSGSVPTRFLRLAGVDHLDGSGNATADLVRPGG
ncbi:MAG: hypothetical protein FWC46_03805 [Actinomycetia bacterium]|nr:hypothetical protein [Actinomycetes bacterium]